MSLNELALNWAATVRGPVVVTGSAGYLGRNLVQTLAQAGIDVVGVQRKAEKNSGFSVVERDLFDQGALDSLLTDDTTIFHLASTSSVARSVVNPRGDIRDSLQVTFEVIESARRFGSRLIYVSSICVADPNSPLPHSEGVKFSPRSPYGACKAASEILVSTYFHCYGLRASIARLSTVYGPGLRRFAVYDFYRKLRSNSRRLDILGDGTQMRDYIYLDDALAGLLLIASRGESGETYNLGSGVTVTSRELARAVAEAMEIGPPEIVASGENFPGDIPRWAMDISKIRHLGFEPRVDLATGLTMVVKSHHRDEAIVLARI